MGLVGPDEAAGKTTTLRMLAGLLDPTEGEIKIAGRSAMPEGFRIGSRIRSDIWLSASACTRI